MKTTDKTKPVLVTGASGYIASWVVKYLLDDGFTVHGTVRDKSNTSKVEHLLKLDAQSKGTLKLFDADLTIMGSFDDAAKDCELVIHMASPFFVQGIKNAEEQLIKPAKDGTRNVLQAVQKAGVAKRVVLTSSVAAVYSDNTDIKMSQTGLFSEADWNTTSTAKHNAYSYSKTIAEREAWAIAKAQDQWDLVTINPGFVLGPSLTKRTDSTSISMIVQMGDGTFKSGAPHFIMGLVDVRDVAKAHIAAGLTPTASGRHVTVADTRTFLDMANMLRSAFGDAYPFPQKYIPKPMLWVLGPFMGFSWRFIKHNVGVPIEFDNRYTKRDLNLTFRPVNETLKDQFQQLLDDGHLAKK